MSTKNFVVLCSYFAQRLTIFVFGRALLVAISSSMMNFDPPRTVARGKLIWCTLSGKRERERGSTTSLHGEDIPGSQKKGFRLSLFWQHVVGDWRNKKTNCPEQHSLDLKPRKLFGEEISESGSYGWLWWPTSPLLHKSIVRSSDSFV